MGLKKRRHTSHTTSTPSSMNSSSGPQIYCAITREELLTSIPKLTLRTCSRSNQLCSTLIVCCLIGSQITLSRSQHLKARTRPHELPLTSCQYKKQIDWQGINAPSRVSNECESEMKRLWQRKTASWVLITSSVSIREMLRLVSYSMSQTEWKLAVD